jgi:MFS family permease
LGIDHRHTRAVSSLWRPLRLPAFRNLLIADVASDIGAFMQGVGAAWMMVSLRAGPFYVALTQTASALPFFLLAMPAGAIGDIVDRRKLILAAEIWMAGVAILLAGVTIAGKMSPVLLLILTFALSAGDAVESPAWRAVLPDLVQQEDLASAAALNGIEFNFARAIGPALAGVVIALAGVGTAFLINAISFVGVIAVIARWKRHPRKRSAPRETLGGATVAAVRYVRYSPRLRTLMIRTGIVTFFASGLLALLPSVAQRMSRNPMVYGLLLGCFGIGAIAGALVMQQARAKWSAESVISGGVFVFGICTLITSVGHLVPMALSMLIGGGAWIVFVSLLNVIVLNHTPEWVRARVLAVSMLTFQGAMAGGSALWGAVATRAGLHIALMAAGAGMILSTSLSLFMKLPEATVDVTPWVHWRVPMITRSSMTDDDSGPVLVSVEYDVQPEKSAQFISAIRKYERIRRRDGAYRWSVFQDLETPDRYLETFLVVSWAEHLRQHQRLTLADRKTEEQVHGCVRTEPKVRHLIYVDDSASSN